MLSVKSSLPVLYILAAARNSIQTLLFTTIHIEVATAMSVNHILRRLLNLLDASPRQRRHPELSLVLGQFQFLGYPGSPSLFDQRQIDGRTYVVVIRDQFSLVVAATSRDTPKKSFASLAQSISCTSATLMKVGE